MALDHLEALAVVPEGVVDSNGRVNDEAMRLVPAGIVPPLELACHRTSFVIDLDELEAVQMASRWSGSSYFDRYWSKVTPRNQAIFSLVPVCGRPEYRAAHRFPCRVQAWGPVNESRANRII